jgi:1,4-dihydroxy-2-naphthoate octaprenyltransferase
LNTAILVVNNLRDRVGDAAVGKRTLAVRFGARFARTEYRVLLATAYATTLGLAIGWVSPTLLAPWLTLPLALKNQQLLARLEGKALNPLLGATARLVLIFSLLLAAGFAAATLRVVR